MTKKLFLLVVLIFFVSITYASLIGDDIVIEVFHDGPGTLDSRDAQGNIIANRISNVQVTQNDIISGTIDVSFTDNSVTVFSPTADAIYNTGGVFTFSIETTPVPEPSSWILLTLCLGGLFVQRKRL